MTTLAKRVDSHLHIWDLDRGDYAWLTPDLGELYTSFLPEEAARELRKSNVDSAVLVQAADTVAETKYLLGVADQLDWVAGVVGWIQLDDPALAHAQLDELTEFPAFRGVRHLVHDDPRPDFLDLDEVRTSLAQLASRGIPFDVPNAWPRHFGQTTDVARAIPELMIVLDHLGKPPRGEDAYADWKRAISATASFDNVVAKVSGLRMPGTEYSRVALESTWNTALELFGPARLMWGSDWPLTVPDGGYAPTLDVLLELISSLSADEQADILYGTASRIYGIPA